MKPTQEQLVLPLAELVAREGRIKAKTAAEALAERVGVERDVTEEVIRTPKGQRVAVWRRHTRFAAMKARDLGLVQLKDGIWQPGEAASERLTRSVPTIVVTVAVDEQGRPRMARLDVASSVPTVHTLVCGDARDMSWIPSESVGLVVTSCPYADLIRYEGGAGSQLGNMTDYGAFLAELDRVFVECSRVLLPGGRIACVVGDVLRSRRLHGRHHVLPLASDIMVRSRQIGLDALTPIHWAKPTNIAYEQGGNGRLGKPGMPNQIIKAESETIVLLRKPGYRRPTADQIERSGLSREEEAAWLRQRWEDVPGQRRSAGGHPAPFPIAVAERLVRLFSFVDDLVLDPFAGSGTTSLAAIKTGRSSIGVEVSESYFRDAVNRVEREAALMLAA